MLAGSSVSLKFYYFIGSYGKLNTVLLYTTFNCSVLEEKHCIFIIVLTFLFTWDIILKAQSHSN